MKRDKARCKSAPSGTDGWRERGAGVWGNNAGSSAGGLEGASQTPTGEGARRGRNGLKITEVIF